MFTRVRFNRKTLFRQMFTLAVDRNSCAHLVRWVEDDDVPGRYTVGGQELANCMSGSACAY